MRLTLIKKLIACLLALCSLLNFNFFTPGSVANWLVGKQYRTASSAEKADMILDLYVNQDYVYLSDNATKTAKAVLAQLLIEVMCSGGNGSIIVDELNKLPVYERGERDATRESYTPDKPDNIKFKASLQKFIDNTDMPDYVKEGFRYFTGGVNDVEIYFLTTPYEGVYEFAGDYVKDNGELYVGSTGVYYDKNSTLMYGVNDNGMLEIGFNFRADDITMSNPIHPWQRRYGFNIMFDVLGNVALIDTNTVRVHFNYNGKDKMIQFWKGTYAKISNGCEIGLYNKREGSEWLYDSVGDDELMYMSLELRHGDEVVLHNDRQLHWWLTGYQPGPKINPDELTLDCKIEFTEQGMLDAFMASAAKAFGKSAKIEVVDGMTAHIIWK